MPGKSANHGRWSEEKMIASTGYVKLRVGKDHPLADPNGYAYEHLVIWAAAGLPLPRPDGLLHHLNEVKSDNRIGNLELRKRVAHSVGHQPGALMDHDVRALREDYAAGDHTTILAKRYGIPPQTAWKIVRGKTRRSAGGPIVNIPLRKAKAAGRLLDGVEHNATPQPVHSRSNI